MPNLDRLLAFDGLDAAERLTGESYKTDKATEALGFAMLLQNGEARREALEAVGDTTFSNALSRYREIIEGAGYELAHEESFESRWEPGSDRYFIYAHRDGLLLAFDSYGGDRVNGGKVFYNWRPSPDLGNERYGLTSSGGWHNYDDPENRVWVGDHDCREALLFRMQRLRDNGSFLAPWTKRPSAFWLAHYMDWKNVPDAHAERVKVIEERTTARLSRCPAWVREMVLFSDRDGSGEAGQTAKQPGPEGHRPDTMPNSRPGSPG